jgi:archaellum biogenesis ATPase FlaH
MKSLYYTEEQQRNFEEKQRTVEIASKFGFLNAHNGLRKGSVHVLMGTPGGGKSTLIRSILRDFLFNASNLGMGVSIQLSEETCDEYKSQLVHGMPVSDELNRGSLISEEENTKENFNHFIRHHEILMPDLLIYDNITTSRFYESTTPKNQSEMFTVIKNLTKKINCATIVVAHTKADISDGMDRMINQSDIRGSKAIPNMTEFFYILQRFKDSDTGAFCPTIRTVKHRGQELVQDMYYLQYEKSLRAFIGDKAITWNEFLAFHQKRQRLIK